MKRVGLHILAEQRSVSIPLLFAEYPMKPSDYLDQQLQPAHATDIALDLRRVHPLKPRLHLEAADLLVGDLLRCLGYQIHSVFALMLHHRRAEVVQRT